MTLSPKKEQPGLGYQLGGLHIHSEIPLPELITNAALGQTDIQIIIDRVPESLPTPGWQGYGVQVEGSAALLTVPKIARYLIEKGQTIKVSPIAAADPADIRLFLLGTAFGIACHQRGSFPLHASAIITKQRTVAFIGPSGAGKSTLGAWLSRVGYPLLTDDVCILSTSSSTTPIAHSGSPRIKLWKDALTAMDIDPSHLQRDLTRTDKFHLTLKNIDPGIKAPLHAIYLLAEDNATAPAIEGPLDALSAVAAIVDNTYRQELVAPLGQSRQHFSNCSDIARHVPVYRLLRPRKLSGMDQVVKCLEQHWSHTQQPD